MKQITISIPDWVPTSYEFNRWKRKIQKFFNPPRCNECGCKLKQSRLYIGKTVVGNHFGSTNQVTDNFAIQSYEKICRSCMKKYIHSLKLKKGTCSICGKKGKVLGHHFNKDIKRFITFLWHWWNYGEHCLTCIDDLLDTGEEATDIYKLDKKNNRYIPDFD